MQLSDKTIRNESNEDGFHSMFDSHKAVMLIIDPVTGYIKEANKAAINFYGYSREQLLNMRIEDINALPPDEVESERGKALLEKRNYFIFPHKTANGQVKWVEVFSSPYVSAGKQMLFSIIHDISERKGFESALNESRNDLNRAQSVAHIGSWRLNIKKNELTWSDEAYRIFNVHPGAPLNYEMFLSFVYPDDREMVNQRWNAALRGEEYNIDHRIVVNDKIKWVNETAILEFDRNGNLMGGFGTVQDITKQKEAQEEIINKNIEIEAILSSIGEGVLVYDKQGKIMRMNNKAREILGYPENNNDSTIVDRVSRYKVLNEQGEEVSPRDTPAYRAAVLGEKTDGGIFWVEGLAHPHWLYITGSPLLIADKHTGGVISLLDITSLKQAELKISEQAEELHSQNEYLTKVNELLEDFVHIAAHDLRGPISSIMMMSELISMQKKTEEKEKVFNELLYIAKKLQGTVTGLMETVNIQMETKGFKKNIFSEVYNEIIEDCHTEPNRNGANIRADFSKAPEIDYVEAYLKSIMKNLVTNALKYSADVENPIVQISTTRENEFVVLTVKDNGIGIDLESAGENLFKPFKRFTSKAEGTGMGLYIIKNIIEKNGGHIKVKSKPNMGTTFSCYLKEYK